MNNVTWSEDGDNTTALVRVSTSTSIQLTYRWSWSILVRIVIVWPIAICGGFGNGLVLAAIRTTPSLQTKTNTILASMAISQVALIANTLRNFRKIKPK